MPFTAYAISAAAQYQLEHYKRQMAADRKMARDQIVLRGPDSPTSAKCPCCGSRQFAVHQSRRICSYCRSEQDGGHPVSSKTPAANGPATYDRYVNYFNTLSIMRRESLARIDVT